MRRPREVSGQDWIGICRTAAHAGPVILDRPVPAACIAVGGVSRVFVLILAVPVIGGTVTLAHTIVVVMSPMFRRHRVHGPGGAGGPWWSPQWSQSSNHGRSR